MQKAFLSIDSLDWFWSLFKSWWSKQQNCIESYDSLDHTIHLFYLPSASKFFNGIVDILEFSVISDLWSSRSSWETLESVSMNDHNRWTQSMTEQKSHRELIITIKCLSWNHNQFISLWCLIDVHSIDLNIFLGLRFLICCHHSKITIVLLSICRFNTAF